MLSPFQIEETEFEKALMGGYKKSEVDAFFFEVSNDYKTLYTENENLKKKIEVLADKIKEYRSDEDYIKDAILYSQKIRDDVLVQVNATSEDIIKEAEAKRDTVLRELEAEKARLIKETEDEIEAVKNRNKKAIEKEAKALAAIKKEVSNFKYKLQETYKAHLNSIMSLPFYDEEAEEDALAKVTAEVDDEPVSGITATDTSGANENASDSAENTVTTEENIAE